MVISRDALGDMARRAEVVLELVPDAVVLADGEGTIRWVGANVPPSLGWRVDDLVGRSLFELLAKTANRPLQVRALDRVLATPGVHGPIEETVVTADGRLREVEIMVTNALADRRIGLLVATVRDITDRDTEMEGVRQRESWASSLLRGSSDLILACDRRGTIAYASPSAQTLLGRPADSLVGTSVVDLVHPDDLLVDPRPGRSLDAVLGTGPGRRPVLRFGHAEGSWRRLRVERSPSEPGGVHSVLLTGRDVSGEEASAGLLSEQTLLLERIARGTPVAEALRGVERIAMPRIGDGYLAISYLDPYGGFVCQAPGLDDELVEALDRAGVTRPAAAPPPGPEEAVAPSAPSGYHRDHRWDAVLAAASSGDLGAVWACDITASNGVVIGRISLLRRDDTPLSAADLDVLGLASDLASIAIERHDLQSRLDHNALHDELTGLPNRRYLLRRMEQIQSEEGARCGLLFVDLDRFKLINDSLGHNAGDELLRQMAERFGAILRPVDMVARVGGDEFVVLCPDLDDVEAVARVAERVRDQLGEPIDLPGGRVVMSVSIGVHHVVGRAEPVEMLRDADLAMYDAKQERGGTAVFRSELRGRAVARLAVESALRDALEGDEMELRYQPVVRLADGEMVGVEALLRWRRPGHGLVDPGDFVPVATDTGLILPIGRWVIEQAVLAALRWPHLEVAANLSARQLVDVDLVGYVADTLAAHRVAPERLCLEVTEADLIVDPDLVIEQLAAFKDLGVRLAIDDFGTGFATLDYLRRFAAADVLKVDASFVAGVADPLSHDLAIVSAAVALARSLGFASVAEGVETEAQRDALVRIGCELAQGYLFSPPVDAGTIDRMLVLPPR